MIAISMRPLLPLLALCAALGCPAGRLTAQEPDPVPQAEEPEAPPFRLNFDWKAPLRARVVEKSLKKGREAEMSYLLDIASHGDEGGIAVRLSEFEFLKIMGMDCRTPQMRKAMAPAVAMASVIPALFVDSGGVLQGTEEIAPVMERVFALMEQRKELDPKVLAQVKQSMRNPQVAEIMRASATKFWEYWVSAWLIDELPLAGCEDTYVYERLLSGDRSAECEFLVRNHGPSEKHPGHVALEWVEVLEGEVALALLGGAMQALSQGLGKETPRMEDLFESVQIATRIEVVTDPMTMRPAWCRSERTTKLAPKDGKPQSQVERHEYAFEWLPPEVKKD